MRNLHYEKFADGSVKCIEDEIPFDLPDGWQWARLGCLAQYKKGPFGSSITKAMFVPDTPDAVKIYEQKNAINKDATLGSYFISAEKYETLKGFEVFPNDIIVSCAGTIGETYVLPTGMRKGIINQALMKISLYDLGIIDFYLMYFDFQLKSAQFASTDCPFRMSGAGSSVEAVWVSGRIFYLFSGVRSRIFLPFISRR